MINSDLLNSIHEEFHHLSRKLTYLTIVLVCVLAMIFWSIGLDVVGSTATIVGVFFMLVAAFTFQIPQITYRYMLRKYRNSPENLSALGPNWADFRDRARQRKLF